MSKASMFFSRGGSLPINVVMPLHTRDVKHKAYDGSIWMRSGAIDTDTQKYPHAFVGYEGADNPTNQWSRFSMEFLDIVYSGYVDIGIDGPTDITMGGGFYWILELTTNVVYQFSLQGVYTGKSWSSAVATSTTPKAVDYHEGFLYILDGTKSEVHKFREDGNYSGLVADAKLGGITDASGLAVDAAGIWVSSPTQDKIVKMSHEGIYLGANFDVNLAGQSLNSLTFSKSADGKFYVFDSVAGRVFRYDAAGAYDNMSFLLNSVNVGVTGIHVDTNNIYIAGPITSKVYPFRVSNFVFKLDMQGVYKAPLGDALGRPRGMAYSVVDDTYYIVSSETDKVVQYDANFDPTGWSIDVTPVGVRPRSVLPTADHIWVLITGLDADPSVPKGLAKYDLAGVYMGVFIDFKGKLAKPRDVASDGKNLFVLTFEGQIHKLLLDGTVTDEVYNISEQGVYWGALTWDSSTDTLWALEIDSAEVHQYAVDGTYTGNFFNTQSPAPVGMTMIEGVSFKFIDRFGSGTVTLQKETGVGLINAIDTDSGIRMYVKIGD